MNRPEKRRETPTDKPAQWPARALADAHVRMLRLGDRRFKRVLADITEKLDQWNKKTAPGRETSPKSQPS